MSEDVELFERWASGDRGAGDRLIRRHFQTVHRFFRNKVSAEVEDLIQRTFLVAVEARDRFRRASSFRTFLLGLARIELLNHYRRRANPGAQFDELVTAAHAVGSSPSVQLGRNEEQRLLLQALCRIPLEFQIVLELSYWERLSSRELGEVLDIPAPTVRSRLRRARELLEAELAKSPTDDAARHSVLTNLEAWASGLRKVIDGTD
ncbi:MAG: RNA polymerase sigma factor [Nannocystales bacterium]